MHLSLALWTSLLSVSVLADPGKDWANKGDAGHHLPGKTWRHKGNALKARTHSGTFTGFIDPEVPDVNQWLGVPYGAPPTGDQRFLPPKPAAYAGDVDTTEYKPICMQNGLGTRPLNDTGGVFWALVPEFQNQDPQSEDCLYLNIWGPRKSIGNGRRPKHQKKVPVIIWICGGGYQEGGGHAPYQVPDHWVQRTQSHIVVTFNYRLSVWGFPGARAAPINAGLADVRLVVEWVRENIEAFGGDPDHMVLWGQSAGGNAANSYGYAYPEDPIVAGIVAQSGTVSQLNSPNTTAFTILAKQLGCDGLDAEGELSCMQQAPNDRLHSVIRSGAAGVPRFSPAVDNVTLFANNTARLESGLVAKVPLILGNTVNEGAAFAPFELNQTQPPPEATTFPFLQSVGCGVEVEVNLRKQFGLQSYRYLSAGNFSNITPRYWLGAMHSSDIPLVFGTHWEFRGNSTELEWETSYSMEGFWLSLASQGSKSDGDLEDGQGHSWPEYGSEGERMVLFGDVEGGAASVVPGDYFDGVYMCGSEEEEV